MLKFQVGEIIQEGEGVLMLVDWKSTGVQSSSVMAGTAKKTWRQVLMSSTVKEPIWKKGEKRREGRRG